MKTLSIDLALALLLVISWFLWAHYGLGLAAWRLADDSAFVEQAAQWPDSFGAFNASFSASGFGAVLAALWFQAASLKEQTREAHYAQSAFQSRD
jgi:hypothetical protein